MTRMQFFKLMEAGIVPDPAARARAEVKFARATEKRHVPSVTGAPWKQEGNKVGVGKTMTRNKTLTASRKLKMQALKRLRKMGLTGANRAKVARGVKQGAAGLAGVGSTMAGGLMFMRKKRAATAMAAKAAGSPMSRIRRAGSGAVAALKKNPKAALVAGAAGLGSMMFMRRKSGKGKKK